MARHRLEWSWWHISTDNVLVFPSGEIGRVDRSTVGHVGYEVEVGEPWQAGEQ
jgi:hypothetical protein